MEQAARGIGFLMNANKIVFIGFNKDFAISLNDKTLKLIN